MPLQVRCAQCGKQLNAPDQLAGKRVKCPFCSAVMQLPAPVVEPVESLESFDLLGGFDEELLADVPLPPAQPVATAPAFERPKPAATKKQRTIIQSAVGGAGALLGSWLMRALLSHPAPADRHPTNLAAPANSASAVGAPAGHSPAAVNPAQPASPAPPLSADAAAARIRAQPAPPAPPLPADPAEAMARLRAQQAQRAPIELGPAPTAAVWNVQADGREVAALEFSKRSPLVPVEGFYQPEKLGLSTHSSPWVAVPEPQGAIGVWNLARGRRTAKFPGEKEIKDLGKPALSDTGDFLAGKDARNKSFSVWSCKDGKQVMRVDWPVSGDGWLQFAGDDRIVAIGRSERKVSARVYQIPEGSLAAEIPLAENFNDYERIAISPGGRYLAVLDQTLQIFELTTGELVGEVALPTTEHRQKPDPEGCAFSPDGSELAALCKLQGTRRVLVWSTADGVLTEQTPTDAEPKFGTRPTQAIQWSPDAKHWLLYSRSLVARGVGKVLWPLKATRTSDLETSYERFIDNGHLLAVLNTRSGTSITVEQLPYDQIEKMAAAASAGGEAVDGLLPPITVADLAAGRARNIGPATADWKAAADPPEPAAGKTVHRPVELKAKAADIRTVIFSAPKAGKFVVSNARSGLNPGDSAARQWLDCYELAGGHHERNLELPAAMDLVDVGPDGTLALTMLKDRLDVWSLDEKSAVVAWRVPQSGNERKDLLWAALVDNQHAVTLSRDGQLVVWELPGCKAIYALDNIAAASLTPGRQFLVAFSQANKAPATLLAALSGDVQGTLETPNVYSRFGAAFCVCSDDGAVVAASDRRATAAWDLATGKIISQFSDRRFKPFRAIGSGRVLAEGRLTDFRLHGDVLTCMGPSADRDLNRVGRSFDGRLWTLAERERDGRACLVAAEMPPAELAGQLEKIVPPAPLLGPGAEVSLQLQGAGLSADTLTAATEQVTRELQSGGVRVADTAPLRFVGEARVVKSTSVQLTLYTFGRGGKAPENISLSVDQREFTIKLIDAAGHELWHDGMSIIGNVPTGRIDLPEGQTAAGYLQQLSSKHQEEAKTQFFKFVSLPKLVYPVLEKSLHLTFNDAALLGAPVPQPERVVTSTPQLPRGRGRRMPKPLVKRPASEVRQSGSGSKYVRERYVELLSAEPDEFTAQVRWLPVAKRPSIGIRWGVALPMTGRETIDNSTALVRLLGPVGRLLVDGINRRIVEGDFGDWPDYGNDDLRQLAVVSGETRTELMTAARDRGLDFVIVLKLGAQSDAGTAFATLDARIIDVGSGVTTWTSPSLSNKGGPGAAEQASQEWAEGLLAEIDENYQLQDPPEADRREVEQRVAEMVKKKVSQPLATLVEVRYYHLQKILGDKPAIELYSKVLGENGKLLVSKAADERHQALEKIETDSKSR